MYPTLFGFIDTYSVLMLLGVVVCIAYIEFFFRKKNKNKQIMYSIEINACIAVVIGVISAILMQNLYDLIEKGSEYKWTWAMTFYGGLIGGVASFLLVYFLVQRKKYGPFMRDVLKIAPASITVAHGFGRIGCFFAGCCYGVETSAWYGVKFTTTTTKVVPTNLFEALFLLALSGLLLFLAIKYEFEYNFTVYLVIYGMFRFAIEFLRGDHRGGLVPGLSPSQFWSIVAIAGGIIYFFLMFLIKKKEKIIA